MLHVAINVPRQYFISALQFLPGEEYAAVLLENSESEVWSICVLATAPDTQYSV